MARKECGSCNGSGILAIKMTKDGPVPVVCPGCKGSGYA